jgi:hypothetical protein
MQVKGFVYCGISTTDTVFSVILVVVLDGEKRTVSLGNSSLHLIRILSNGGLLVGTDVSFLSPMFTLVVI